MKRRAALFFGLLTLFFYAPLLWGEVFLPVGFLYRTPLWYDPSIPLKQFDMFDAVIAFYPYQELLQQSLAQAQFPFWNPYNFAGHPIAFNGWSGFFYPPRILLLWLFPTWLAHGLSLALHTFVAGFATWWLVQKLGRSPSAGAVAGVAWMFNPLVMAWLETDHLSICAAWTPLCLLAVIECQNSWRGAGWLGLAMGFTVLAGHLQIVLYTVITVILVGLLILWHLKAKRDVWFKLGTSALLASFISAPMLIPTAYYLSSSQRPELGADFLINTYQQFLATSWTTVLLPQSLGNGNDFAFLRIFGAGEFIYAELCLYFGLVTLALALLAFFEKGLGRWLMLAAVLILVIPSTPLYHLVYVLPGFNKIMSIRSLQLVHFLVALSAAFGTDLLDHQKFRNIASGIAGIIFCSSFSWASWTILRDPGITIRLALQNHAIRLPKSELFLSQQAYQESLLAGYKSLFHWGNPAIWIPLGCVLACCLIIKFKSQPKPWLVGLLVLELFVFGKTLNAHHPHSLLFPNNSSLEKLKTAGLDRVMGLGTIKPNTLLPSTIQDIAGYDAFYPRATSQYLAFIMRGEHRPDEQLPAQVFPVKRFDTPLVDLLGVKYLVGYPGENLAKKPLVQAEPLPIFENPNRLPRAFLASRYRVETDIGKALNLLEIGAIDPRQEVILTQAPELEPDGEAEGSARIESYGLNRVEVSTDASVSKLLVLTDGYAEGWKVTVDGKPSPIFQADVMFRAVALPAGKHRVTFTFHPVGFRPACVFAILGIFLSLGLLGYNRKPLD